MKLHLVSLGCAKNLVDSELMLGRLQRAGWTLTEQAEAADTIIVNTCSFIGPAIDESIDTILELARFKINGACRRLIVAGCLPQRFKDDLAETLPEVDLFLGTGAFDRIEQALNDMTPPRRCLLPDPDTIALQQPGQSRVLSSGHLAYLKVAEGCSRQCTYCIIPTLRGRQRSRCPDDIVAEAQSLIASGIRELVLVAQDTTAYGRDLSPPADLAQLLGRLATVAANGWVRFLYGHPESIDEAVIQAVAEHPNICPYFDIPVQHAADRILKRMGRRHTRRDLEGLFARIRATVPEAALRTTVIVGFPGESDDDFRQLVDFVETVGFDHLGVFTYSDSQDLPSHRLSGHVPGKVARRRRDLLMARQSDISLQNNQKHLHRSHTVLIDEQAEEGVYIGRTKFQAPEVDGLTYVHAGNLRVGSFCRVTIRDALEYDLSGDAV